MADMLDVSLKKQQALTLPAKKNVKQPYASPDQQTAVEAIIKVVEGHRRRPLVITADRGRGKSASLGIASGFLLAGAILNEAGIKNIIVCAPSKNMAKVIFESAKRIHQEVNINFYSPDELQQQKPKADLLLIDELAFYDDGDFISRYIGRDLKYDGAFFINYGIGHVGR